MNKELREIRIAKLQIMATILIVVFACWNSLKHPVPDYIDLLFMPLYMIVWYLCMTSIRTIEEEEQRSKEKNEVS